MKENKNIERLFQEKFKDFEAIPPLDSWATIEERLNQKKKKRRVIPFWFKTSGIAATLILGMFIFKNVNDNSGNNTNEIVIDKNTISNVENSSKTNSTEDLVEDTNSGIYNTNSTETFNTTDNNTIVLQSKNDLSSNENLSVSDKNASKTEKSNVINFSNQIVVSNSEKPNSKKRKTVSPTNKTVNSNEAVVSNTAKGKLKLKKTNLEFELKNKLNSSVVNLEKENITTNSKLNLNLNGGVKNDSQAIVGNKSLDFDKNNSLLQNKKQDKGLNNKDNLNTNSVIALNSDNEINEGNSSNLLKNNIKLDTTYLVQNNTIVNAIQDSALVAEVNTEENPLEKLLKEKSEGKNVDEKEKEKRNKWAVSTNASPIYFNSTSKGSPIDEQFIENEKAYASSLSYGVGFEYEISKRFSVKTGVNSLAVNYNTNNVYYETNLNAIKQDNINITRNENARNISLSSTDKSDKSIVSKSATATSTFNQGDLKQEIGFVEVPLELSYKILDSKFGINLVGGMSTLFLNTNTVSLISKGTEMDLGTANNLNNIHFSSNVGLGFKYTFWKSFQANFQPTFKYQINTFSNDSGNFKPYFIGLYSGISFSF